MTREVKEVIMLIITPIPALFIQFSRDRKPGEATVHFPRLNTLVTVLFIKLLMVTAIK